MNRKPLTHILYPLLLFAGITARAQSPGGVPVKAWYRADAPATLFSNAGTIPVTDNALVYQWNEYTGTGYNLVQSSAGARPVFSNATTLANFNPTVTFDGSNDFMQFSPATGVDVIDRATGALYVAGYVNQKKRSGVLGFHPSMDFPGLHFHSDYKLLFFTSGGPGYQGVSNNTVTDKTYFTAGGAWENNGGNPNYLGATVSLNGDRNLYSGSEMNNVNLGTGYRDLRVGGDNNWGSFSGQLNELLVFENRLTDAEMDRVETYLSIKYGITYANGAADYKNSGGLTVWNATVNNGFHYNIAGIARDDNGALYQKQSWSTNAGTQVLIGVGSLANTNAENAGTLADGQYLVWGDNGLAKVPQVPINYFAGISHHFSAIWKVQNSGSVGTVRVAWPKIFNNLVLIQSADDVIDAGDATTNMAGNEITINGIVYNYADVTLADGTYFTFGAKLAAPGGVTEGLIMWHKADDGTTAAGPKNIWRDISGNEKDVTQNNNVAYQPIFVPNATYAANGKTYFFNYNPFYYFDGSNDFFYRLDKNYFPSTNSPGSVYGVMFNSSVGGWRTPYGWGDDDPNLNRQDDNYYFYRDNSSVINTGNLGLKSRPAHIGAMAWRGTSNGVYLFVDGQTFTANAGIGSINSSSAGSFSIGSEGYDLGGNGNEVFQGGISEVFAYTFDHQNSSNNEKLRINSYLAIKYGITLLKDAGNATSDYLSSESVTVWDAAANTGYNNNVAGIARDDNSALHQKQSQSNRSGQQVLIGTTGLANTNELNSEGLSDGQFLMWGDNGLSKAPSVTLNGVPGVNFRFAAVWKVQNTGNVGTVRVTCPTGLTNITLLQSSDPTFASVDAATDMSANVITINGATYNYADVTLTNGEYFTFAVQMNGPGGVAPDLRVWLRADAGFTPSEWTDFSGNNNHYTQTNDSRKPFVAEKMYNFNPVIDFGLSNSADGRFMVLPAGKPFSSNITATSPVRGASFFTLTLSRSNSGSTDVIGFGNTTTGSGLINADRPALGKLGDYFVMWPFDSPNPDFSPIQIERFYLDDISFTYNVPGIKFGKNGQLATTSKNVNDQSYLHFANGSVLGSQSSGVRNGYIAEVIAYERDITEDEKKRVRTYVAIKYGITLAHDYISADSLIVWDTATNAGYNNNIAGIARDDEGSLYQKQSNSINPGLQVLISTPGLNHSNATNTGTLANEQFLLWGDNGLARSASVPVSGIAGVNYRFAAIWKVQNTNNVGTVRVAWRKVYDNLVLIQSADEVFDASDVVTEMNGVQTVDGVEYAYADLTLADGQYFTFAAFVQAPGGVVEGLLMWHKANDYIKAAGPKEVWQDISGNGRDVYQVNDSAYRPTLITDPTLSANSKEYFFNFNPFYYFDGNNDFFYNEGVPYFPASNSPGSVYGVIQNSAAGGWRTPFSWADDDPCLNKADNNYVFLRNNGDVINVNVGLNNLPAHIGSILWRGTSNGTYLNLNGRIYANEGANIGTLHNPTLSFAIGSEGWDLQGNGNEHHQGGIGEIFAYSTDHRNSTGTELRRINTYLALKYGITLTDEAGTGAVDYLNSNSDTIYSADNNFRYNIAGIGHDYPSGLHQKQSRSVNINPNGQLTIGILDIAETNQSNANELSDGQFLVWGDNGKTAAMTNTTNYAELFYAGHNHSRRMTRIWRIQNIGVSEQVKIRFPKAGVGTTTLAANDACAAYVLVMAADSSFTTGVSIVPLAESGDDYEVMNIFPAGISFFTFGKATPVTLGSVYLPETTVTTSATIDNCGLESGWTYFAKDGDNMRKLFAAADVNTDQLTITITTEGAYYDNGIIQTRLMPRITTVDDASAATYSNGRVRIYYSPDELAATMLPGAVTNGWFKYDGPADSVIIDIYSDGKLNAGKTIEITPNATGIEDGVYYVEFHNITSFSSFIFVSSSASLLQTLPMQLTGFTAKEQDKTVQLSWVTSSESNNKGFTVERSIDAVNWQNLGFVASKGVLGNSSVTLYYGFNDAKPHAGRNYYRLKQTDFDGNSTYSGVVRVDVKAENRLVLLNNPVENVAVLKGVTGKTEISIYDVDGRLIKTVLTNQVDQAIIDVSTLNRGIYIMQVKDASGIGKSFRILKQ
jgi:hypothetical protein